MFLVYVGHLATRLHLPISSQNSSSSVLFHTVLSFCTYLLTCCSHLHLGRLLGVFLLVACLEFCLRLFLKRVHTIRYIAHILSNWGLFIYRQKLNFIQDRYICEERRIVIKNIWKRSYIFTDNSQLKIQINTFRNSCITAFAYKQNNLITKTYVYSSLKIPSIYSSANITI
jgi:hypothetical protein